jgi:hypothetical protein
MTNEELNTLSKVSKIRGYYIELSIQLEYLISEIIAYHYCKNNDELRVEYMANILYRESFSMRVKIDVFQYIMETHYSNEYDKMCYSKADKLRNYNTIRNQYAHNIHLSQYTNNMSYFAKITIGKDQEIKKPILDKKLESDNQTNKLNIESITSAINELNVFLKDNMRE